MSLPSNLTKVCDIGKGCFGEVILCYNNFLNKKEAVKIVNIDSKNSEQIENIFFEPMVLEYLRNSDYIVKVYDAILLGTDKFIIRMEYLEKGSLEEVNILSIKDIIIVAEHISYALEYAHNNGIFHLDVKPGNILINDNGGYKLSDFGLSNIRNEDGCSEFKMLYNFHTPPENIDFKGTASEQTDVYMLGMTLYRLVNGKIHYLRQLKKGGDKELILKGKFPDRNNYLPHISKKIKSLINKSINIDLSKRFKTIKDFRNSLNNLKIKLFWIPITSIKFECYNIKGNLVYNIDIIELPNQKFSIELKKHNDKSITRVNDFCFKNIIDKDIKKYVNNICSKFT